MRKISYNKIPNSTTKFNFHSENFRHSTNSLSRTLKAIRDPVNPNQQVISFSTNFVIFLKGGEFWEKNV
jgi:hypothetical protein